MQSSLLLFLPGIVSLTVLGKLLAATGAFSLLALLSTLVIEGESVSQDKQGDAVGPKDCTRRRVLIVGAGEVGRTLAQGLEAKGTYQVVGFVDDQLDPLEASEAASDRFLGTRRDTARLVKQYGIDEVIIAYAPTWQQRLTEQLAAESPEVTIRVIPSPYEAMMKLGQVGHMGDIALVNLDTRPSRFTGASKRVFDLVLATSGLILLAPFLPIIVLLIKLTSKGPVIFSQERVGRYGQEFPVYKFRTMERDAERHSGPVRSSGKSDTRLTRVGRWLRLFRIDELPQLWNVLRGEMSLVGPRPERPNFVENFQRTTPTYARRHEVRPGITGLAQVCGGYHTDARDKLRFDLIYVSHHSVWYDVKILFRTILVVILPNFK